MPILPLALLGLLACGPQKKALRQERRDKVALMEATEAYWDALRWGDARSAADFVEPEDRAAFEAWLTGWQKDERMTDYTLLGLELGTWMEPPLSGRVREATITLKTERVRMADQVVRAETITQRWYRDEHDWYVEWP